MVMALVAPHPSFSGPQELGMQFWVETGQKPRHGGQSGPSPTSVHSSLCSAKLATCLGLSGPGILWGRQEVAFVIWICVDLCIRNH